MRKFFPLLLAITLAAPVCAQTTAPAEDPEVAYTKTINERADKIVATLGLTDPAQTLRVRDLIAGHYRNLRDIQATRDTALAAAKNLTDGKAAAETAARAEAATKIEAVHRTFLASLGAEITPAQIDQVKDGLTYNVLNVTYKAYQELLPNLTADQKRQILAWLYEAREYAMDGGSSNEKHGWFGKYKGRINNYLAKAGINMKEAEKARAARTPAQTTAVADTQ